MQAAMRMLGENRYHPYVIVSDDRQQQHRSKSLGRCEEDQPKRFGKLKNGKALRGDVELLPRIGNLPHNKLLDYDENLDENLMNTTSDQRKKSAAAVSKTLVAPPP